MNRNRFVKNVGAGVLTAFTSVAAMVGMGALSSGLTNNDAKLSHQGAALFTAGTALALVTAHRRSKNDVQLG